MFCKVPLHSGAQLCLYPGIEIYWPQATFLDLISVVGNVVLRKSEFLHIFFSNIHFPLRPFFLFYNVMLRGHPPMNSVPNHRFPAAKRHFSHPFQSSAVKFLEKLRHINC